MAHDRAQRFESVLELKAEVEAFLRGGSFFTTRTFAPGAIICREGDPAEEAYVITTGHAEAFRKQRGKRLPLRTLGPGDVFGEGAIFAAGARNASVAAIDEVTAVVVSREVLHEELALDSWMGAFVRALAHRYRDFEARNRIAHGAAEQARIVAAIVEHVTRSGAWARPGVLESPWSRLWAVLGPELRLPEAVVLAAVARSNELHLDEERDRITLDLPPLV